MRAIDQCTCGHARKEYHAFGQCFHVKDGKQCTCPGFFPNPQPEQKEQPSMGEKIVAHLSSLGEVSATGTEGVYRVTAADGEMWEVSVTFRRQRQTTAPQQTLQTSPEGV